MQMTERDLRILGYWAADCAERVLPLFAKKASHDTRPREAIAGIRAYAQGGKRTNRLRVLVWAAMAAAREAEDPAAAAAARAAYSAAGVAYMHASYTPGQEKHALGPAMYAALARELAANDPAAADKEIRWALQRASPAVRKIVRRLPARKPGHSRQDALYFQLDGGLRENGSKQQGRQGDCSVNRLPPEPLPARARRTRNRRANRERCPGKEY